MGKARVTENDLKELSRQIAKVVDAGERGDRRQFLELDYAFHRQCWALSGNPYLAETLDRLMAPLFIFVVLASGAPLTGSMGREHYELVNALQNTQEPEFTAVVRKRLTGFTSRWLAAFSKADESQPNQPSRPRFQFVLRRVRETKPTVSTCLELRSTEEQQEPIHGMLCGWAPGSSRDYPVVHCPRRGCGPAPSGRT